jgi:hypothetical protein
MRDEDILLNLFEISQWLDRLIKEIQGINLVMTDLIATVPVSVEAWDTVGERYDEVMAGAENEKIC